MGREEAILSFIKEETDLERLREIVHEEDKVIAGWLSAQVSDLMSCSEGLAVYGAPTCGVTQTSVKPGKPPEMESG